MGHKLTTEATEIYVATACITDSVVIAYIVRRLNTSFVLYRVLAELTALLNINIELHFPQEIMPISFCVVIRTFTDSF